jgi:hypothetical protein
VQWWLGTDQAESGGWELIKQKVVGNLSTTMVKAARDLLASPMASEASLRASADNGFNSFIYQ